MKVEITLKNIGTNKYLDFLPKKYYENVESIFNIFT